MATATAIPSYPFDPSGRLASNLVTGEQHPLTGVTGHDHYFFIPQFAPFFEETLQIVYKTLQGETRILQKGVDFYPSHHFYGASRSCGKAIFSSITMLNRSLVGTATVRYQTLGGEWIESGNVISEVLADRVHNPRITTWEQVVEMPGLFPVIDHEWNLTDLVGMSAVVDALHNMSDKILEAGSSLSSQHINAVGNPHGLTASDIGAVTRLELKAAVSEAMGESAGSTDTLTEGEENFFFTQERVRATVLGSVPEMEPKPIEAADTVLQATSRLQAQVTEINSVLDDKLDAVNPVFRGLIGEHLETIDATTATTVLRLNMASAWRVNIKATGSIQFDTSDVEIATGNIVEFTVTTINDATPNRAISWPANVRWVDGITPPRSLEANARDEYYFTSDNDMGTWTGSLANKNVK